MSSLKDYLAQKYQSNEPRESSKSKKKKSKKRDAATNKATFSNSIVDDDADDTLLSSSKKHAESIGSSKKKLTFEEYASKADLDSDYDSDGENEYNRNKSSEITSKKPTWKSLDGSIKSKPLQQTPTPADSEKNLKNPHKYYGLQTADQIAAQVKEKKKEEAAIIASLKAEMESQEQEQGDQQENNNENNESSRRNTSQTIFRDETGRRIENIEKLRQEEYMLEEKAKRDKERINRIINAGLVQQRQKREEKKLLDSSASGSTSIYTRSIDDEKLNEELKSKVDTFNDPAAMFLSSKKRNKRNHNEDDLEDDGLNLEIYHGPYPQNRFGIAPGCMWDGVDRSNGFEKLWFKKSTEIKERKSREYTTSYDV